MFGEFLNQVRSRKPHIHCITNYVTANDCANILLASGSSPIMADCPEESAEITALCDGLLLNTGTLNPDKLSAMRKSGRIANELHHSVVLDPVGAGASRFRTESIKSLLKEIRFDVIRGNLTEIKALFCHETKSHGVDAVSSDRITEENLPEMINLIKTIASEQDTVIAVTGQIDIIADKNHAYCIRNGCSMMKSVTGSGCQLSALISAFITANPERILESAVTAVCAMGVCGEIALKHLAPYEGNASFRNRIIDAVYHLDSETLDRKADYQKF